MSSNARAGPCSNVIRGRVLSSILQMTARERQADAIDRLPDSTPFMSTATSTSSSQPNCFAPQQGCLGCQEGPWCWPRRRPGACPTETLDSV